MWTCLLHRLLARGQFFGTLLDAVHKTNPVPVTDNCDATPTVNFQDVLTGPFPNNCLSGGPLWIVERTWTAVDDCGNTSASQVQLINLFDTTPPEMNCPPENTVEWGDPQDPPVTGIPEVTDNCDPNPIVTHSDVEVVTGGCLPAIVITRTFTATDLCGNASVCTQIVKY